MGKPEVVVVSSDDMSARQQIVAMQSLANLVLQPRTFDMDQFYAGIFVGAPEDEMHKYRCVAMGSLVIYRQELAAVNLLAVSPDCQRSEQKYGSKTLAALEGIATDRKIEQIEVDSLHGSVGFYRKRGYTPKEFGEGLIHMSKTLVLPTDQT